VSTATSPDREDHSRAGPKEAVDEAASHRLTQFVARSGLAARGAVYLLVAFITGHIALGSAGTSGGTGHSASGPGAVRTLAGGSGGRVALIALAAGLAGYAVFSVLDAVLHHDEDEHGEARHWADRLVALWGAVLYAAFSVWTFSVAFSAHPGKSDSGQSQSHTVSLTSHVLSWPAGQFLVGLVATIIAVAAALLFRRAVQRNFLERFDRHRVPRRSWQALQVLGVCGIGARAVAYLVITGMIFTAAVDDDPRDGQGLDGSLRAVAARDWGPYLLFPIALGLFFFGLYLFFEARYRRVGSPPTSSAVSRGRSDQRRGSCAAGSAS
jgi:hypothetical protein